MPCYHLRLRTFELDGLDGVLPLAVEETVYAFLVVDRLPASPAEDEVALGTTLKGYDVVFTAAVPTHVTNLS